MLRYAVAAAPDVFSWSNAPRRVALPDGVTLSKAAAACLIPVLMIAISGTGGSESRRGDKVLCLVFPGPAVICQVGTAAGEQ